MVEATGKGISRSIVETSVPEKNALEALDGLFLTVGAVTKKSSTPGFERPLSLRAQRARIWQEMHPKRGEVDREKKRKLLEEAHERDDITRQYLTQREIHVDVEGAGKQMSRFVTLKPPSPEKERKQAAPVVIVPGASNDIDCVGTLAQEMAYRGNQVVVLGYPESFMGKVTPEFIERTEQSDLYGPHTEFYKKAIEQIIPKGDIELWGYSNGGPIAEEMLTDPKFSGRVKDAVIVAPTNSVDQSLGQFASGIVKELKSVAGNFTTLPRYTFTTGNKRIEDKNHLQLRNQLFKIMIGKILKESNVWKRARVKEGGRIVVVSGTKDEMTKSARKFNERSQAELSKENPQLMVIEVEGSHAGILIDPKPAIDKIQSAKKNV
jgi:hypothetical protein